jgi:hypothetical protein
MGLEIIKMKTNQPNRSNDKLEHKTKNMKRFFTLLLSSLFSLSLLAYDGSRLSVSFTSGSTELKIEIDGREFSMKNNSITLSYLAEGSHQVKIFREKKRPFGSRKKQEVLFNSSIYLKKGFHTDITVNRFGKVMTDERRIDVNDDWYSDEDDQYDSDNDGWEGRNSNVMSARDFEIVKDQLRSEWFESNRLISATNIIEKSCLSALQVKDLMLLFTFEKNRLEVAKSAYRHTEDKENYYKLNDALTFSSSKEELARFIRESR